MFPTHDQIQTTAYYRWLRRRGLHGRDREDWLAAQNSLLFGLNYEVVARYDLERVGRRILGDLARRYCRFCERTAPAADFVEPIAVLPKRLGISALMSAEVCSECHEQIREHLEPEFARFAHPFAGGTALAMASERRVASPTYVPLAAFKALAAMALMILPASLLVDVEDTIEWVVNPDHDLDSRVIGDLACQIFLASATHPCAWAALSRRAREDDPFPYFLFALGLGHSVFQISLPLTVPDQDLDGTTLLFPLAYPSSPSGLPIDPITIVRTPLASVKKTVETRFSIP